MLKVQRRHRPPCKKSEWDAGYLKCKCPIVILGTLNRKRVRESTKDWLPPDKARDLDAAQALALHWQKTGSLCHLPEYTPDPEPDKAEPPKEPPTIEKAVTAFLNDARDRGLSDATREKKKTVFGKSLLTFAKAKGIRYLQDLDLATLQEWRATWNVASLTRYKRQKSVIGFLWFCERAKWFDRNYASDITLGLGKIQTQKIPTGYFPPADYAAILDATFIYSDRPSIDKHDRLTVGGERIRAVTELMRWTGLRIGDAVTLEKNRLTLDQATGLWNVILPTKKTGESVYCPIPPDVAKMLLAVPASQKGNTNATYFFWTGNGTRKTIVANWQRSFGKLFRLAGLKKPDGAPKRCHPHMFRDTFAVESILSGVPLKDVSITLGHASIKTTEESYMPWVLARQHSLNQSVYDSWVQQGKVAAAGPQRTPRTARVVPITRAG